MGLPHIESFIHFSSFHVTFSPKKKDLFLCVFSQVGFQTWESNLLLSIGSPWFFEGNFLHTVGDPEKAKKTRPFQRAGGMVRCFFGKLRPRLRLHSYPEKRVGEKREGKNSLLGGSSRLGSVVNNQC